MTELVACSIQLGHPPSWSRVQFSSAICRTGLVQLVGWSSWSVQLGGWLSWSRVRSSLAIRRAEPVQLDGWLRWSRGPSRSAICRAGLVQSIQLGHPPNWWHWKANSKLYLVSKDGLNQTMGRSSSIAKHLTCLCRSAPQKIEAIQREIVEIQGYIARRPEASASIDIRNNKSTNNHRRTSVDEATNRGRLVPKFNFESLGDRLQKTENTTATMKDRWHRGDEGMRDFTDLLVVDSTKDTKVDQPVNYATLAESV
ncbi:hypothetical protein F2Q69_00028802 [Brassica cretica]|uniref:Uncharacterized protein n=1 Tax=Brassica cretica TaxID=69181 RepID=A0A8S9S9R7_BRACR|nr:hypothetical protein F2Q69_00028802 [Brassica cretica]